MTQLLVEAFVLACAGGLFGLGIAHAVVAAFRAFHPPSIPRADAVAVDAGAVLYTFAVVTFCTFAAGLWPAFVASRGDIATSLRSAGRGGDGSRGHRVRGALAAAEIAVTLALVIASSLVIRSYVVLTSQPLGFDAANVTIVDAVDLPDARYAADAAADAFMSRALQRVAALPGVRAASWAYVPPFTTRRFGSSFVIAGRTYRPGSEPATTLNPIGPEYFRALGARLVAGRAFTDADRLGARPVAMVNETFARTYFPGQSPLGRQVVPDISLGAGKPVPRTIVGVSADIRYSFTLPTEAEIEVPVHQFPQGGSSLIVAHEPGVDPGPAAAAAITALDPLLPAPQTTDVSALMARNVATQRLTVYTLGALAFVALALALAGVFAVVSYGVTQRTHEFGVRMALGADGAHIVRTVLGGALRMAALGSLAGLIIAGAGTRLFVDQLYETQPLDPAIFSFVTLVVLGAAAFAAFVPARRATRVDPIVALRYE